MVLGAMVQQHRICLTRYILGDSFTACWLFFPSTANQINQIVRSCERIITFRARFCSFTLLSALILPTTDTRTFERDDQTASLPLISGNGSYLGFSFVFINRKDVETNSWPCLKTVSAVHSAAAHGHRPLASLEIRRKSADANVYVSFLPTVAVPGSDCAIFERVYIYNGIGVKFQNTQKTGKRRLRTAEYI